MTAPSSRWHLHLEHGALAPRTTASLFTAGISRNGAAINPVNFYEKGYQVVRCQADLSQSKGYPNTQLSVGFVTVYSLWNKLSVID
jgi:hypothetical protein